MSKVSKLRDLTTKAASADHQEAFDEQTADDADDRSFCLLLSAMLENSLDQANDHWIGEQTEDVRKALYDQDGLLATFARKITFVTVIGIAGPVARENLRLLRHVRNAFAHAKLPITFDTPEVATVCADLVRINIFDPPEEPDQMPGLTPRKRFQVVTNETMMRLLSSTGFKVLFWDDDGVEKTIIGGALP
ncbi:hypothetical protein UB31_35715 [Bradyrhizobium sp. LTSP849]|uniref:hypothetical protein n=1 Tax=Bradyrhizobium sp. LTSP849 TaxID=1615890 RepID=UPI0005D1777D|nr:hypothetical protein [Bradyrhizobium sp. LTSP849]KJC36729.1 hypothetical protein UB31_35715 [Bradyrhizobium sp. LTSP849]